MRKKIFILIYFILTQIIFAYDFSCIVDSEATIRPYRSSTYVETTDKFANQKILVSTDEVLDSGYLLVKDYNSKIYIDSRNLKLENSYFFDEIFKNKKWLLKTCVDALYNSDPSLVYEYTGNVKDYVIKNQNSMDFPEYTWDEYVGPVFIEHDGLFFEISEKPKSFASFVSLNFLILNIDDSYFTIYIDYIYNTYDFALKYYELNTDEVYKFKYQLDGDYLNLYLDDELFISFVNADASLIQEYTDFIKEKNYLLANVKWPKHANGSCDYNDSIANYYGQTVDSFEDDPEYVQESLVLSSNSLDNQLEIDKEFRIFQNTKLQVEDNDWSEVISEIPENTKIKILEISLEDCIHNVSGRWVKVEVLDTELKGKTGYIFSAYLKEIEQEQPNNIKKSTSTVVVNNRLLSGVLIGVIIIVLVIFISILLIRKKQKTLRK